MILFRIHQEHPLEPCSVKQPLSEPPPSADRGERSASCFQSRISVKTWAALCEKHGALPPYEAHRGTFFEGKVTQNGG